MKNLNLFFAGIISKLRKSWRIEKEKINRKIDNVSLISKVLAFSMIMATSPAGTVQVQADASNVIKPYDSAIKLDTNKSLPLVIPVKDSPNIVLGESNFDKETREAQEKLVLESKKINSNRTVVARESVRTTYDPDLSTKRALAKKAAAQYGIDWKILEAVWQVESGKAWSTSVTSYAGAQGPMQFMYGTWKKYAVDGNGDGQANINEAEDAVYAGASLLAQSGGSSGDYTSALLSYNHAMWYVNKVKAIAFSITD